jgi:tetratricopeptide (TPR) repeat protein
MKQARMILVAIAWAAAFSCSADVAGNELHALLGDANHYFRQANAVAQDDPDGAAALYEKAILRYERILREGALENGGLYYNIGNAYFRMKDIGRAILNYRRAEQYIPNDPNLQQNLSYARARRTDKVEEPQEERILKTVFFWHYDLSARVKSVAFAVTFVTVWLAAATRLFTRRKAVSWALAVSAVLAAAFLVSLLIETADRRAAEPGVVLSEAVVARKGDSETYEPSFQEPLHAGTEFEVVEERGRWYHVALADGRRCWLPAGDVGLVRSP